MAELIDFFDENDQFVLTADRHTKRNENKSLFVRGVHIFLVNSDGEVFVQKRMPRQDAPHKWEIPSGHVQTEEHVDDAAKRELKEETGITAHVYFLEKRKLDDPPEHDYFYAAYSDDPAEPENQVPEETGYYSLKQLKAELKKGKKEFVAPLLKLFADNPEWLEAITAKKAKE